jgi:glycosyltransferase domain-containing protein
MGKALIDQVTLLVPVAGCYDHLESLRRFYQRSKLSLTFVVLDSVVQAPVSAGLKMFLEGPGVVHKVFSSDMPLAEQIARGMEEVKTPYCVLCPQGDFISPRGLEKCVEFLESSSDHAMAQGHFIQHLPGRGKDAPRRFFWGPLYSGQRSVETDDPVKRFQGARREFRGLTLYAVFRTELFRLVWSEAAHIAGSYELAKGAALMLSLIHSRIRILPVFFCSRRATEPGKLSKYDFYRQAYAGEAGRRYVDCCARHLAGKASLDACLAEQTVREELEIYLNAVAPEPSGVKARDKGRLLSGARLSWKKIMSRIAWHLNKLSYMIRFMGPDRDVLRKIAAVLD